MGRGLAAPVLRRKPHKEHHPQKGASGGGSMAELIPEKINSALSKFSYREELLLEGGVPRKESLVESALLLFVNLL
jgi:hypothetical protein